MRLCCEHSGRQLCDQPVVRSARILEEVVQVEDPPLSGRGYTHVSFGGKPFLAVRTTSIGPP